MSQSNESPAIPDGAVWPSRHYSLLPEMIPALCARTWRVGDQAVKLHPSVVATLCQLVSHDYAIGPKPHAHRKGWTRVHLATLAAARGLSERAVQNHLNALIRVGLISRRVMGRGRAAVIVLHWERIRPGGPGPRGPVEPPSPAERVQRPAKRVQDVAPKSAERVQDSDANPALVLIERNPGNLEKPGRPAGRSLSPAARIRIDAAIGEPPPHLTSDLARRAWRRCEELRWAQVYGDA